MIRTLLLLPAAALALALGACSRPDPKQAMIDECVNGGQDKTMCTCVVTETEKAADPEIFRAMTLHAEGKVEEAQKIMEALPKAKQLESAMVRPAALLKCLAQPAQPEEPTPPAQPAP